MTTTLPTETRPNEDLLVTVLAWITQHPEVHDQGTWGKLRRAAIGARPAAPYDTAACFAGWTAVFTGRELDFDLDDVADEGWAETSYCVPRDDPHDFGAPVEDYAADVLGLRTDQANALFAGSNTRADIEDYIAEFLDIDVEELRDKVAARGKVTLPPEHLDYAQDMFDRLLVREAELLAVEDDA